MYVIPKVKVECSQCNETKEFNGSYSIIYEMKWECSKCKHVYSDEEMRQLLCQCGKELTKVASSRMNTR